MSFESLPNLPEALLHTQCVWGVNPREELLICGGMTNGSCYSYHILKREYKYICDYPIDIAQSLWGHTVIKCEMPIIPLNKEKSFINSSQSNEITLLSFVVEKTNKITINRTLMMKYQSVWNSENNNNTVTESLFFIPPPPSSSSSSSSSSSKKQHQNKWIKVPQIEIEKIEDMMHQIRAVVGGSKNQLLFIIFPYNNIAVFDFQSFKLLFKEILPVRFYSGSCLVRLNDYKDNDSFNIRMIMFYKSNSMSIEYNEINKKFKYTKLPICIDLQDVNNYLFVYWNDFIVLLGGYNCDTAKAIDNIYIYSISKQIWRECIYKLPIPTYSGFAILDPDYNWIHILGGNNLLHLNQHLKIKIMELIGYTKEQIDTILNNWIRQEKKLKKGWIVDFHKIIANYLY